MNTMTDALYWGHRLALSWTTSLHLTLFMVICQFDITRNACCVLLWHKMSEGMPANVAHKHSH